MAPKDLALIKPLAARQPKVRVSNPDRSPYRIA